MSEIIEFNRSGYKVRVVKYSASYNRKTRKRKKIDLISSYIYNSDNVLLQIVDTVPFNIPEINNRYFTYDSKGKLESSNYYRGEFETPDYVTKYSHNPYRETTIQEKDSIIVYQKTKEFEKDFYVKRFYGFSLEPKLKRITKNGNTLQYSDESDLSKFNDDKVIKNLFDKEGKLISSDIKSIYMNDRITTYHIVYSYYKNDLIKSIRGYVPYFFTYEYYE
ncbi:MAG: hypothetical protein EOO45_20865 [Flavobacterium sp.]|nr:MAG: hypothetical protein EOO45_20865 [Flavobacterium sp.]